MRPTYRWYHRLTAGRRKRQRAMDREILFPIFHDQTSTAEQYEGMVAMHISMDSAWRFREEWEHEGVD